MQDPRFERLPCTHQGIYADDCIVHRVQQVTTHLTLAPSCSSAGSPCLLSPALK
jgi:rRNA-processing protein FCF1